MSFNIAMSGKWAGITLGPVKVTSEPGFNSPNCGLDIWENMNIATLYQPLDIRLELRENCGTHCFLPKKFPNDCRTGISIAKTNTESWP